MDPRAESLCCPIPRPLPQSPPDTAQQAGEKGEPSLIRSDGQRKVDGTVSGTGQDSRSLSPYSQTCHPVGITNTHTQDTLQEVGPLTNGDPASGFTHSSRPP